VAVVVAVGGVALEGGMIWRKPRATEKRTLVKARITGWCLTLMISVVTVEQVGERVRVRKGSVGKTRSVGREGNTIRRAGDQGARETGTLTAIGDTKIDVEVAVGMVFERGGVSDTAVCSTVVMIGIAFVHRKIRVHDAVWGPVRRRRTMYLRR
jgi:hypothetical protein